MLSIAQVKVGNYIVVRDEPYKVISAQHTKMGRGGGILKMKGKNLLTGALIEMTFKDSDRIEPADLSLVPVQFLYKNGQAYHFMDNATYDQFALNVETVGKSGELLKDGSPVEMLTFREKPIGVQLPPKVDLVVTYTEPTVAGNTVSSVLKNATLETGAVLKVPLFIKIGDILRINTETGEYVERANK